MISQSLTFLGAGRMAGALIRGIIHANLVSAKQITLSSKSGSSAQKLAREYGVNAALGNQEAIMASSVIFLCTKPAQALETLVKDASLLQNKLIISLAAGIMSEDLFVAAGGQARIIRTMPNIAVRINKGVTTITPHSSSTHNDLLLAQEFFGALGSIYEITEDQLNGATALSGSGPAFALLFLEALLEGGLASGIDSNLARRLSAHALAAAATLILETEDSPLIIRREIASPKGTTEAGLEVLEKHQFSLIVREAVVAAKQRAQQLSEPGLISS